MPALACALLCASLLLFNFLASFIRMRRLFVRLCDCFARCIVARGRLFCFPLALALELLAMLHKAIGVAVRQRAVRHKLGFELSLARAAAKALRVPRFVESFGKRHVQDRLLASNALWTVVCLRFGRTIDQKNGGLVAIAFSHFLHRVSPKQVAKVTRTIQSSVFRFERIACQ